MKNESEHNPPIAAHGATTGCESQIPRRSNGALSSLVILNPHAAGGRARGIFEGIKGRLSKLFGELVVAVTETSEEVSEHIDAASAAKITHLTVIGGDGTNHAVINALVKRPGLNMTFGSIPVGTGRDWARTLGVPADPQAAVDWLTRAQPVPCDLGRMEYVDMEHGDRTCTRMFLNIASAGVSGEIDRRVNRARRRTRITFLRSTITTLLKYKPQRISVKCDGAAFYSGAAYLLAVANGRYFGRGMFVAPSAVIDDGLFDVVLVEKMPRRRILLALPQVFSGEHVRRGDVHCTRAAVVDVHSDDGPLALDLDGEEARGQDLRFTMLPAAVNILMSPAGH